MKRVAILLLAAEMLLGASFGVHAIDFKISGEWLMGFSVGEGNLVGKAREPGENRSRHVDGDDKFSAAQRLRIELEAVASENLSGTVQFQIGTTQWGKAAGRNGGGALGADSTSIIGVRHAYLDWTVPNSALKFRMGIQDFTLPNAAGGAAVLDVQAAGITAAYQFNDNVGLTAIWVRPFNDNYSSPTNWNDKAGRVSYLDNMDIFGLLLPLKFDGFELTPWLMYGIRGKNTGKFAAYQENTLGDGLPSYTFGPNVNAMNSEIGHTGKAYGNMFWAGLPLTISVWDPWNIEIDLNYGYVESMGRFDATKRDAWTRRASTERQGWLAKALVEYKMDWGKPGIFGWYASGDDGNPKNGSKRMPTICSYGNFTSFLGDGNLSWTPNGAMLDYSTSYSGTWGIGVRVKDVSFVESLKHTLTVAYWGGTNAPAMAKYMDSAFAWNSNRFIENYLTTRDGLLEVNLVNSWHVYENLEMNLELGYVANFMDNSTWNKARERSSFQKQDMWKAQLIMAYTF